MNAKQLVKKYAHKQLLSWVRLWT